MPSHAIVAQGLEALRNLDHRGATGADPRTGDGAGILMQVPDAFLRAEAVDFDAAAGRARTRSATPSCPTEPDAAAEAKATIEQIADEEHLQVLGWRTGADRRLARCPTSPAANMPVLRAAVRRPAKGQPLQGIALDRLTYCLRRRDPARGPGVYFASLSCRTLVYKGMLTTEQLELVFPELLDERMASALAVVHSRFSTNTFPAWELAHPFRMIAHNGEINTVKGNRNWMRAREALLAQRRDPGRPGAAVPDLHAGRLGLRLLRRGGRAAAPRRPLAAARDADDDPGGVGEQRRDGPDDGRTSTPSTPA